MEKVKGRVTAVSEKKGKYGISLGQDNWFNGFGKAPCKKGDEVEIIYKVNGNFRNIESVYGGNPGSEEVESPKETCTKTTTKTGTYPKDPVGLAVEIFCGFLEHFKNREGYNLEPTVVMSHSIQVVKQAQEAFKCHRECHGITNE